MQTITRGGRAVRSAPGFGCCLRAKGASGASVQVEGYCYRSGNSEVQGVSGANSLSSGELAADPEKLGDFLARELLTRVRGLGCPDPDCQPVIALCCAVAAEDVSLVRFGRPSPKLLRLLRVVGEFFGIQAQLEDYRIAGVTEGVNLVVRGAGVKNVSLRGW